MIVLNDMQSKWLDNNFPKYNEQPIDWFTRDDLIGFLKTGSGFRGRDYTGNNQCFWDDSYLCISGYYQSPDKFGIIAQKLLKFSNLAVSEEHYELAKNINEMLTILMEAMQHYVDEESQNLLLEDLCKEFRLSLDNSLF